MRVPEEGADQKHKLNPRLDPCFQELFQVKRTDLEMPVISGSARRESPIKQQSRSEKKPKVAEPSRIFKCEKAHVAKGLMERTSDSNQDHKDENDVSW